jgi:hypothetical protein
MARARLSVDPKLRRQLVKAAGTGDSVEAVFMLRSAVLEPGQAPPAPAELERQGREILERVSEKVNSQPARVNIMKNLGMLVVDASHEFIAALMREPDIASAAANQRAK